MATLPVSGAEIALREPDGADDMLLHESSGSPVALGLALLTRLAEDPGRDFAALSVTDFEFLLLNLYAARLGPRMTLGFACPHCRTMVEVSFLVADYAADITPRAVPGVAPDPDRLGWFRLDGAGFRLPTAGDLAAAAERAAPARVLAERCLDETARRKRYRARVERAMEMMAPEFSRPIAGDCPACGATVQAGLSVSRVVMAELKRRAGAAHDEVDLIARAYHWPESEILALPQHRRRAYAERIRRAHAQAA
jgi:hypothetical protein